MPVYSLYKKQRILYLKSLGQKVPMIARNLEKEGMMTNRRGIHKFLMWYSTSGTIARLLGSGRPSKVTAEVKRIVEKQMRTDDRTMAHQLSMLLLAKGYSMSLRTILHCQASLGWMFCGGSYCQLIRKANKVK